MKYDIPQNVKEDIIAFAIKHDIDKVVLFGSRARGTNTPRSDVDIAVYGENFDDFYFDVLDNVDSLLVFDMIDMNGCVSMRLLEDIERDGGTIYEKI